MDLSLIISIIALLVVFFVLYINYLKPFELYVNIGKHIIWADKDKNLRIDLLITFMNLGKQIGMIENLLLEFEVSHGDGENGFKNADIIIDNEYHFPWIEHAFIEPEGAIAAPDKNSITVWMGCHDVYRERQALARGFGWPEDRFRVIHIQPGGSFGGKNDKSIGFYAALLAHNSGKPVKFILNRVES